METRILVGFVGVVTSLAAGCMSKPASDIGSVTELIRNPFSRSANAQNDAELLPPPIRSVGSSSSSVSEFSTASAQLRSSDVEARAEACQRLGTIATQGSGNFEAMDLLTKTMQSDLDAEVRAAATNALLAIEDPSASQSLEALVVQQEDLSEPVKRLSLLEKIWR